jgi:hypothetical protein
MKLICRKWNAKGNKTVEITPARMFENSKVVTLEINSLAWNKIKRTCGKDTDFGFITEDRKSVEIVCL